LKQKITKLSNRHPLCYKLVQFAFIATFCYYYYYFLHHYVMQAFICKKFL